MTIFSMFLRSLAGVVDVVGGGVVDVALPTDDGGDGVDLWCWPPPIPREGLLFGLTTSKAELPDCFPPDDGLASE